MLNDEVNKAAEVEDRSERVSRNGIKGAKQQHQKDPKTRGHPNPHKGRSLPRFEDVLDAYANGKTAAELSQQFGFQ